MNEEQKACWNRYFASAMELDHISDFFADTDAGEAWRARLSRWFVSLGWKWKIIQGCRDGQHWVRIEKSDDCVTDFEAFKSDTSPIVALLTALYEAMIYRQLWLAAQQAKQL